MSHYRMHRGWMDHKIFRGDRYSRAQAWEWLIAEANWRDTATLKVGQLSRSVRQMAQIWKWDVASVARLLRRLESATMIATDTAAGQTVITILNYNKYQAEPEQPATPAETPTATDPQHNRNGPATIQKKEEGRRKKNNKTPPIVPPTGDDLEIPKSMDRRLKLTDDQWQQLWTTYYHPDNRGSKAKALSIAERALTEGVTFETMLAGVEAQAARYQAPLREGEFRPEPAMAQTWFGGKRWETELETAQPPPKPELSPAAKARIAQLEAEDAAQSNDRRNQSSDHRPLANVVDEDGERDTEGEGTDVGAAIRRLGGTSRC